MKKNLFVLVCFAFFVFACGKASETEMNDQNAQPEVQQQQGDDQNIQIEDVQNPEDLFKNGKQKFLAEDYAGAIKDFSKSLEMRETAYVRADLGRAKEAAGDLEGALADYTKAIEKDQRGLYYKWRADLYTKMGKTAESKKDMAQYEKLPKE